MKNKLKEIRTKNGIGVTELATKANTSRQTIHAIENGSRKNVSGSTMLSIADALNCTVEDIFFASDVTHVLQNKIA